MGEKLPRILPKVATYTSILDVELLKHFKISKKLLQHVSVYKETIIREPQPVLG
jgi:hypothetical protein